MTTVLDTVSSRVAAMEPLVLLLRASLVVVLVNSNDDPGLMLGVAVLAAIALPRPAVLVSPWLWAALFVAVGARQLAGWHTLDDHVVVTTYWCGAVALCLRAQDPLATMALSARWLIGTLFAFAAGWKLLSGQFVDGTFFRYTLLFDDRFEVLGRLVGGTSDQVREANLAVVSSLINGTGADQVALREGPRVPALAQAMTWWGLGIEVVVAVLHLVPLAASWVRARNAALVAFALTTYLVVPVGGFGALLLLLGAVQASSSRGRNAYLLGAGGLLVWGAVWPVLFLR